jgi:hypothetical protein
MREAILRPELRKNKEIERSRNSKKSANAPGAAGLFRAFMNPLTSGGKSSAWDGRASLFSTNGTTRPDDPCGCKIRLEFLK